MEAGRKEETLEITERSSADPGPQINLPSTQTGDNNKCSCCAYSAFGTALGGAGACFTTGT